VVLSQEAEAPGEERIDGGEKRSKQLQKVQAPPRTFVPGGATASPDVGKWSRGGRVGICLLSSGKAVHKARGGKGCSNSSWMSRSGLMLFRRQR